MLKISKKLILVIFFKFFNLISYESSPDQIPYKIFEYLQTKEVNYELKEQLNKIFYQTEVMQALSQIYKNYSSIHAREILLRYGFTFIDQSISRVFQHKLFPNLVFKIGYSCTLRHTELINAGRIRYAELINEKDNNRLKAPKKNAYMPYIFKSEGTSLPVSFACLPICIVVAEFIKREDSERGLLSDKEYNLRRTLLKSLNYYDGNRDNVVEHEDSIFIIDTEPHGINPEYPENQ